MRKHLLFWILFHRRLYVSSFWEQLSLSLWFWHNYGTTNKNCPPAPLSHFILKSNLWSLQIRASDSNRWGHCQGSLGIWNYSLVRGRSRPVGLGCPCWVLTTIPRLGALSVTEAWETSILSSLLATTTTGHLGPVLLKDSNACFIISCEGWWWGHKLHAGWGLYS